MTIDVTLDVSSFTHSNKVSGLDFITVTIDGNSLQAEAAEDHNYLKMGADGKGFSRRRKWISVIVRINKGEKQTWLAEPFFE